MIFFLSASWWLSLFAAKKKLVRKSGGGFFQDASELEFLVASVVVPFDDATDAFVKGLAMVKSFVSFMITVGMPQW